MRILQIVLPGASAYEQKSQRADLAALTAAGHEVTVDPNAPADLAHVYAGATLPSLPITIPFIANVAAPRKRFALRQPPAPRVVVSPVAADAAHVLPEVVDDSYFREPVPDRPTTIGTFAPHRPGVLRMLEQTTARLQRFRDDIDWLVFERPPSPEELAALGAWVDPATDANDFDGYVAEALAGGLPVVAARTPINVLRGEKGRTVQLVPPGDPNELAHAILAALFKPELSGPRVAASRQTISKFRARQRLRVLLQLYENLTK